MCTLRVCGDSFDAQGFLATSSLRPAAVMRDGLHHYGSGAIRKRPATYRNGFYVGVSNRDFEDVAGQVADAVAFLDAHRDELLRLRAMDGIEQAVLDFPADIDRHREHIVLLDCKFPVELLRRAADLGLSIELTGYVKGAT